jgi:ParB/RepB/Spo0J family partition protein
MAKKSMDQTDLIADFDIGGGEDVGVRRAAVVRMDRPVKMIHVDSIVENSPTQTRVVNFDPVKVKKDEELLHAVKEHGVLQPVMVKQIPSQFGQEAQYIQVFGHRRVAAARAAEVEYVPAIIARSDEEVSVLTIVENVGTRELSGYERATALRAMLTENPDMKPVSLAKVTGIPKSTVYNLLQALEDSPEALLSLFAKGLGMRSVTVLQPVFEAVPEEKQAELSVLLEDVTSRQAESLADAVTQGIDPFVALNSVVSIGDPIVNFAENPDEQIDEDALDDLEDADISETSVLHDGFSYIDTFVEDFVDEPEDTEDVTENQVEKKPMDVPGGETAISAIAALCGVEESDVMALTQSFDGEFITAEELTVASWYFGHGGNKDNAISLSKKALSLKTVSSLIRRHKAAISRAKALIVKLEQEDDMGMADFLRAFFTIG